MFQMNNSKSLRTTQGWRAFQTSPECAQVVQEDEGIDKPQVDSGESPAYLEAGAFQHLRRVRHGDDLSLMYISSLDRQKARKVRRMVYVYGWQFSSSI